MKSKVLNFRFWAMVCGLVTLALGAVPANAAPPGSSGKPRIKIDGDVYVYGCPGTVSIVWSAPNTSAAVDGYCVRYRYESRYRTQRSWKDLRGCIRTGQTERSLCPPAEGDYEIQVKAYNADGDGPWSPTLRKYLYKPRPR